VRSSRISSNRNVAGASAAARARDTSASVRSNAARADAAGSCAAGLWPLMVNGDAAATA
jgi:hypothetical protein